MPRGAGAGSDVLAGLFRERQGFRDILDSLPPNERTVIALRFGLDGEAPMTPEAIGQRMGASREQIRQVEASALSRLRARLVAPGVDLAD
jgi:RNA polymerase primary sigma factor